MTATPLDHIARPVRRVTLSHVISALIGSGITGSAGWAILEHRTGRIERSDVSQDDDLRQLRATSIDHEARLKVQEAAALQLRSEIVTRLISIDGRLNRIEGRFEQQDRTK